MPATTSHTFKSNHLLLIRMDLKTNWNGHRSTGTCGRTNFGHVLPHRETTLEENKATPGDAPIGDWPSPPSQLDSDWPMTAQSANTLASLWAEHPSRCAHGPGRGDHATPSRPRRLSACAGGAACVTAVRVSGTDGLPVAPVLCPVDMSGTPRRRRVQRPPCATGTDK